MRLLLSIFAAMLMAQSVNAQSLWRNYWTTNRYPQNASTLTNIPAAQLTGSIGLNTSNYFGTVQSTNILDPSNVKYWGAKGDGATDDTAAIQAALNSITNRGGRIYIPKGDYRVSELVFGSRVPWQLETNGHTIYGDGQFATRIIGTASNAIIFNFIGQRRLTFSDLAITTAAGVVAQTAMLLARETNSEQAMYQNINRVYVDGHFSKAGIVHMAAELCDYDRITVQNREARPCFYAARENTDLQLTNNYGAIWEIDTTCNSIRNSTFYNFTNGGNCISLYGNVSFSIENNFFGSDAATNSFLKLICKDGGGASYFTGVTRCRNNVYEGDNGIPYYLENTVPSQTAFYFSVSDHGSRCNLAGWAGNTNSLFACSDPAYAALINWDIAFSANPFGSKEVFRWVENSTLLFPFTDSVNPPHPTTVNVTYGAFDSKIVADAVTVGANSSIYEIVTPTNTFRDAIGVGQYKSADVAPLNLYAGANVNIYSTDAVAANKGGSLSLGGMVINAGSQKYGLAAIKGAKENASDGDLDGYLSLYTSKSAVGSVERMRIKANGFAGIGFTNPIYQLQIKCGVGNGLAIASSDFDYAGSSGSSMLFSSGADTGNAFLSIDALNSGAHAVGDLVLQPSGGLVGIGKTNPVARLDVTGDIRASTTITATNGFFIPTQTAPPVVAGGGTLWNSNSVLYWVTATKTNMVSDGR